VRGEFRQVCDNARSGLVGRYLTVLDLKTSCRALSASVRGTKTIYRGSCAPQPIRKCHEGHVSGIGAILILDDSAPSLNAVSRDKKSASARQADGATNFNPIWPRQKICSSTTKNRLVCGNFKPRRQRQRQRRQTKGLMRRTMAVHVRYNSPLPSSAKQQREMTKFCVVWRTWTTTANCLNFYF